MKQRTNLLTIFIPLFILLSVVTIPYIWIILTSFKTRPDIMSTTPVWLFQPSWGNYVEIFHKDFGLYLTNSIIIGFSSTIICVTIGTLAAYCFSRYKVFAGDHLFFYILATRLGPPAAYGVPMYLILDKLGLTNTHIAIILAHATFNLAIIVWMMKSFFDDVPKEVEEAAYLDGCNPYKWRDANITSYDPILGTTYWDAMGPSCSGVNYTKYPCVDLYILYAKMVGARVNIRRGKRLILT